MDQAQKKKTSKPYSPEFRERAVRLLLEHCDEYQSEAAALTAIAGKLGCSPDSLRVWANLVWTGLCGVRYRRVCAPDLRLARLSFDEDPIRSRRTEASNLAKKDAR